jgi:hypothetical protein
MHKCIASSDSSKSTIELLLTKPHTMEDKEALLASYLNHPSKGEVRHWNPHFFWTFQDWELESMDSFFRVALC